LSEALNFLRKELRKEKKKKEKKAKKKEEKKETRLCEKKKPRKEEKRGAEKKIKLPKITLKKIEFKKPKIGLKTSRVVKVPEYDFVEKNQYGTLAFNLKERTVYVWVKQHKGAWGFLSPLVSYPGIYEIQIKYPYVRVSSRFSRLEVKFVNVKPTERDYERLLTNLTIASMATRDLDNPEAYSVYDSWRLLIPLTEVSGTPTLYATKVIHIPSLKSICGNYVLAARLILLAISREKSTIVHGVPGSGKTTLLNSILNEIVKLFPELNIAIVETTPEIVVEGSNVQYRRVYIRESVYPLKKAIDNLTRYARPDILVLGEARTEYIDSWASAVQSGQPSLTTFHSDSVKKCIENLNIALEMKNVKFRAVDLFNVYIGMKIYQSSKGSIRILNSVYLIDENKHLKPMYIRGKHMMSDREFLDFIHDTVVKKNIEDLYTWITRKLIGG